MKLILDLSIYKKNKVYDTINMFKEYIKIDIESERNKTISLVFKGENSEVYSKEFCNYLIILQNKG